MSSIRSPKIRTFSANEKLVEERREKIIHCARQLFVKKGYDRTSMRDIGKACGMTPAGMYHYLGKKDDILSIVVNNQYAMLFGLIRETEDDIQKYSPLEALTRSIERYYRGLSDKSEDALFINHNNMLFKPALRLMVIETMHNVVAAFEKILIAGRKAGDFHVENSWLYAFNIVGMAQLWILRQDGLKGKCNLDQYIKFQTDHFLNDICTPKARAERDPLLSK
jgi:TetR/AcrR family transcriptional regulator, cholesterol catabolism regulator